MVYFKTLEELHAELSKPVTGEGLRPLCIPHPRHNFNTTRNFYITTLSGIYLSIV